MSDEHAPRPPGARLATMQDFPEILRLTNVMYNAFEFSDIDPAWETLAKTEFEYQLSTGSACAFVIDDPADLGVACNENRPVNLIASGMGLLQQRIPTFWALGGKVGYVQWMSTNPNLRGSGLGSQILAAIMRWFDERDVDFVDLNASEAAQQFYERANFEVAEYSGMRSYFRDAKTRKWIAENLGR